MYNFSRLMFYLAIISFLFSAVSFAEDIEDEFSAETVNFEQGLLSINAKDIRPEDLMKEVGEKCDVEIVALGEVFSEIPVSTRFEAVPLKTGLKRILRCSGIANYLMRFAPGDNGTRVVRLDLIGKKGGEKRLTDRTAGKQRTVRRKKRTKLRRKNRKPGKKRPEPPITRKDMDELQESFMNVMDDVLKEKFMNGEQPDPEEVLRIFNEAVPPDIREKMPPEVLEQLEGLK